MYRQRESKVGKSAISLLIALSLLFLFSRVGWQYAYWYFIVDVVLGVLMLLVRISEVA